MKILNMLEIIHIVRRINMDIVEFAEKIVNFPLRNYQKKKNFLEKHTNVLKRIGLCFIFHCDVILDLVMKYYKQ